MTRIGVTGHRDIPAAAMQSVRTGIRAELAGLAGRAGQAGAGSVEALSCLAAGADQLFAATALELGLPVTAVIPGMDYEDSLGGQEARAAFRHLLKSCTTRVDLPVEPTHEDAYYAAGCWIVDHADRLVAVWDGHTARGRGGTGDIVEYALRSGVPVSVLWSPGVRRV